MSLKRKIKRWQFKEKILFLLTVKERLLWLFKKIIHWPRRGEIVFIAELSGAVAVYRGENPAEELRRQGLKVAVLSRKDPWLLKKLKRAGGVVLSRVPWQPWGKEIVKLAKEKSLPVVVDFDDLIFDLDSFRQTSAYQQANLIKRRELLNRSGEEFLTCSEVRAFTVSTTFLQEKLKETGKPVLVVKNKLSQKEWRQAEKLYRRRQRQKQSEETVKIGYLSGSLSHDRDLATILPVLAEILRENKKARLYIVGYISAKDKFYQEFKRQIVRLPFGPRWWYYQNLAKMDINLVPLEDNDFCQAKSEIKFIEAGAVGVPTVAKKNQTFQEAITDGQDGFLADTLEEWKEKIGFLVNNVRERRQMGEEARRTVQKKYLTIVTDFPAEEEKYYQWWRRNLKIKKNKQPIKVGEDD